jgi:two-component system phosphate regulon response regulator PhoB/two-component system alkaline phosphatase synthesis response regulator PhoP
MSRLVAIVDDESDIVDLVSHHLGKAGFTVEGFLDAGSFFSFLEKKHPDLVILDLMLPDADGLDVCKDLKRRDVSAHIPIIMLTAKGEETDKVLGLELGADDYVTKPFSPKELIARVRAVLRRQSEKEKVPHLSLGGVLDVDLQKYSVSLAGKPVELTSTEFRILALLLSRKGWVFTRSQILDHLWGHEKLVLDRTIDVHIRNLRQKLGKASRFIKNLRGVGYKIEE